MDKRTHGDKFLWKVIPSPLKLSLHTAKLLYMNCVSDNKKQFIHSYNCMCNILEIREGFM